MRRAAALLPLLGLAGCSSLGDLWSSAGEGDAADVPFAERAVEVPQDPNTFLIETAGQGVIGEPQVVFAADSDTLSDLARELDMSSMASSGCSKLMPLNPAERASAATLEEESIPKKWKKYYVVLGTISF